jgi:hypothetical protein
VNEWEDISEASRRWNRVIPAWSMRKTVATKRKPLDEASGGTSVWT